MRPRELASAGSCALAVAISIFAVGGAPRWAQALVALATGVAVVMMLPSRRTLARPSPLVALIAVALVLTAIQLLPLPHAIAAWLNPTAAGLRDDGAALVGRSPGSTLSFDVPGTLVALGYFLTLLGLALVAARIATSERGRYRVIATVAALCGLAALVTGIDIVTGAQSLYGLYRPLQPGPWTIAPLLNNNHFGCLMAVGAVLSIGLAAYRKQPAWLRVVWLAEVAACGLAMLNTLSRGAALALALGGFVTIATLVAQRFIAHETPRRRRASLLTSQLPIAVVAVCTVVVVLYAGAGGVAQQLEATKLDEIQAPRSKFAAWRSAAALVEESPWVGEGRGAMEPVFTRVHPASAYASYSHLENEYLQAVVDFGVPGALVLGFAAVWLVYTALRRWRDGPLAAGALGAVAVVMLQSNVDFGVEILGIAAPITVVAATLAYVPLREASPRALSLARLGRVAHVAALAILALLLLTDRTRSVEEDHLAVAHATKLEDVSASLDRHPLDYYNYQVVAELMIRAHDANAVRLLNHALVLNPYSPGLHLLAARLLFDSKHAEQATVEYATALSAVRDPRPVLAEIATRFPPDVAATAIPMDPIFIHSITTTLDELHRSDIKIAWLGRLLEREPTAVQACDLLYDEARAQGDTTIVALARHRCGTYQPGRDVRIALARALLPKHGNAEVAQMLGDVESWQGLREEKLEAWLLLCDAHLGLEHWDDAARCLRRLDASGLLPADREAEIATRMQKIQDARAATPP